MNTGSCTSHPHYWHYESLFSHNGKRQEQQWGTLLFRGIPLQTPDRQFCLQVSALSSKLCQAVAVSASQPCSKYIEIPCVEAFNQSHTTLQLQGSCQSKTSKAWHFCLWFTQGAVIFLTYNIHKECLPFEKSGTCTISISVLWSHIITQTIPNFHRFLYLCLCLLLGHKVMLLSHVSDV